MTDFKKTGVNKLSQQKTLLAQQRREIIAMESGRALEAILGAPMPVSLVQSFSDQDLHFLMHHIGEDDFVPVLSMAGSDQWEFLMDVALWDKDRVHLPRMTHSLELLFKADPQRLLRWAVKEKPALLEYYFFKHLELRIREHDEDPSDFGDDYVTLDHLFYFRFPKLSPELVEAEGGEDLELARQKGEALIMEMLNMVAGMDLAVCHGLLLETASIIPSEVEEEEFRLKTVRLAEKGFLPFHEAVGIYQPLETKKMRQRPPSSLVSFHNTENLPMPPQSPDTLIRGETLFAKGLACLEDDEYFFLQSEFAALVNQLISADQGGAHNKKGLESAVKRACAYLSLGLEMLGTSKETVEDMAAAALIRQYFLVDIFRKGAGVGVRLKTRALMWHKESWMEEKSLALGFLGERWMGVLGGLFLQRPLFFDNYETGVLYREFEARAHVTITVRELSGIMEIDRVLKAMSPDLESFSEGFLTYKTLWLTLWAADRLSLPSCLAPIALDTFRPFFEELFSNDGTIDTVKREDFHLWLSDITGIKQKELVEGIGWVIQELFDELEGEYGGVRPRDLDARFVTHFLIKG